MKLDCLARPFARVWGRPLDALRLEVFDPLGQGLLHAPRPMPPESLEHVDSRLGVEGSPSSRETRRIDSVLIRPAWGRDHFRIDALRQDNAHWLARDFVGRGLGALGSAMVIDLVIGELGLHRVEVDVCPENERSLGVCRRLGLREEGLRPRFMHINGAWADHLCFSIDRESLPEGGLVRSRILAEDD